MDGADLRGECRKEKFQIFLSHRKCVSIYPPVYLMDVSSVCVQWLGLVYPEGSIYVDSLRECYEAYVIYNFMMYLLAYLNADYQLEHRLEISPQVHHMFPLCCLPDWEMGREFVHMCKHGILQYTAVRPITTAISL